MGIGKEVPWLPWIFIDGTDKVEGGLMCYFSVLFVPLCPPGNFSSDSLDSQLPCVTFSIKSG